MCVAAAPVIQPSTQGRGSVLAVPNAANGRRAYTELGCRFGVAGTALCGKDCFASGVIRSWPPRWCIREQTRQAILQVTCAPLAHKLSADPGEVRCLSLRVPFAEPENQPDAPKRLFVAAS